MFASPVSLRRTLLVGLCASALVMGACRGGDKPVVEEITVETASLGLTSADESALAKHFIIKPRSGDEATSLELMSAARLNDATYSARTIDGSSAIYTDWTASNDEATVTAEQVEMIGLHETEDGPTLDKLVVRGMRIVGFEGEGDDRETVMDATVGGLVVVEPSAGLFEDLTDILMAREDSRDTTSDAVGDLTSQQEFRAFQLEDMTANVIEDDKVGILSVKQVIVGNNTDDNRLDAVVEAVDFDWKPGDDEPSDELFNLQMDGLTVLGFDTTSDAEVSMLGTGVVGNFLNSYMSGLSPTQFAPYEQVDLGKVDLKTSMFDLSTDGFEADSETAGSKTVLRSVLSEMVLTFKDVTGTPVAPYIDVLRANGLAEITVKGSQTTTFDRKSDRITVSDARMEIDGGLRTNCEYAVQGLQASVDALKASGVSAPVLDLSDDATRDVDIDDYVQQAQAYGDARAEANKQIKIESLNCDIQDVAGNSLVDRGYKVASEITGSPVAVLKGGAKTMIALGSLTARTEFERDMLDSVGGGLIDFIDKPGQTMTVIMAPETPVSITSLTGQDGSEPTIKPLGLSVKVQ